MDYKEFVEELVKEIGKETGFRVEFCAADEVETQDCMNVYTNENGKLRLLTEKIYCKMKTEGKTLSEVVQAVKQSTDDFLKMGIPGKLKKLQCYEQVKDKLFIRLLNVEKNKEELENSLYKQNGEIALTLYMKISNEDGKLASCKVPLSYVEKWPVKKETVFEKAMKNTMSMMPPRVCEVLKLVQNPAYEGEDIYASDYEGDKAGTKIERYNKGTDAVQALKQGKIDCVIIDSQPAEAFVEKNDDLQILDEPFADEEYAICISKDKPELTKEFNKALAELKKDGTLDSIADNYIGDDTKGKTPYESPKDIEYPNGKLVMATNATFEPYEYYDGDNIVGIDADIAKAICDKLGYELQIEDMEFDSIIAAVQSGKADFGAAGML